MKKIISLCFVLASAGVWASVDNQPQSSVDEQALREYVFDAVNRRIIPSDIQQIINKEPSKIPFIRQNIWYKFITSLGDKGFSLEQIQWLVRGFSVYSSKVLFVQSSEKRISLLDYWEQSYKLLDTFDAIQERLYQDLKLFWKDEFDAWLSMNAKKKRKTFSTKVVGAPKVVNPLVVYQEYLESGQLTPQFDDLLKQSLDNMRLALQQRVD